MNQDFVDLLQNLSDADARFLVVGAYAVAVHGRPRATGDLDVWIEPTSQNARRVYEALSTFGAPLNELTLEDLETPDIVFQMGVPPRRIDILTSISGVSFSDAWDNRTYAKFDDVRASVIGLQELIQNKEATGRDQDIADVGKLKDIDDNE